MTFEEWIQYHDERAKKHSPDDIYHEEHGNIVFDENNGFIRWFYNEQENILYITEITGNARFWEPHYMWVAKIMGAKKIVAFSSMENPKVLERLFKAKVEKELNHNGKRIYQFSREVE